MKTGEEWNVLADGLAKNPGMDLNSVKNLGLRADHFRTPICLFLERPS
jgi:hypothetical protein